jgi:adenylate cyclase
MKFLKAYQHLTFTQKYRIKQVITVAFFWTIVDLLTVVLRTEQRLYGELNSIRLRETLVFSMSLVMGYLLVVKLKRAFRKIPLLFNFLLRSGVLILAAFLMNFIIHFAHSIIIRGHDIERAWELYQMDTFRSLIWINKIIYWLGLFLLTQLIIEVNEKYSPGVFMDIMLGKYVQPKIQKRIVMFMDLKDSTPIAEKLGHQLYFKFIRDFIFHVSNALIEHGGSIYQYVGDEIVVSWLHEKDNTKKCLSAVISARRQIQKAGEHFRRHYDMMPEFRVGIHLGDVTVGEIGVVKKDLAMSGDTMNTTARIRSACNELNQKFIISKDFNDNSDLKDWQSESLGIIELKGKGAGIELFSLKI